MTIASVDALLSGAQQPENFYKILQTTVASQYFSLFYAAGRPGAAVAPSPGINGAALTTYAGQLPSTGVNSWLRRAHLASPSAGVWSWCDRLWHNSGIAVTTTTAQTITSGAFPARDNNGATSGDGVFLALEVTTALANAGAITNCTVNYTNQAGTASRTGTIYSIPISPIINSWLPFELQAGDYGVRSVQGITLGTSLVSGAVSLVAFRPLIMAGAGAVNTNIGESLDAVTGGLVTFWANSVPFLVWQAAGIGNNGAISGYVKLSQ